MRQKLHPVIADTAEPLSDDMAQALMLLEIEHLGDHDAVLTEDDVRAFIRQTPYAHVADDFEDYFLLWAD